MTSTCAESSDVLYLAGVNEGAMSKESQQLADAMRETHNLTVLYLVGVNDGAMSKLHKDHVSNFIAHQFALL